MESLLKLLLELGIPYFYIVSGLVLFGVWFGLWKLISRKSRPLKKWLFWIVWLLTTAVSFHALVFGWLLWESYTPSRDFTTEFWLENPRRRVEVIDDLIDSRLLIGNTPDEVVKILGPPLDNCHYFRSAKWDIIYHLGTERGLFAIDSEWLLIWLDADTVSRCEDWRD